MKRKIIILCMTALMILSSSFTAFAQEFDQSKTGSISVTLTDQYNNEPIAGADFNVYYIATVGINAKGNLNYIYNEPFDQPGVAIDDPSLVESMDSFVKQCEIPAIEMSTDANGMASCHNLALGLYLVTQTNSVEGFSVCKSFLVTVPSKSGNEYLYEVNASPKTEVVKLVPIIIKKEWNTDASTKAVDSITVQLLQNGTAIKTAILNEENNWEVIYKDMPESDSYSIKEVNVPKGFTATYSQKGYVFTVTNTSTLIQTGQLTWPISIMAAIGMLLITVGVVLLQKKREENA